MLNYSFLVALPLFILILFESIYRGSVGETFEWLFSNPNQFFVNFLLMFGVVNAFYWLRRKIYLSVVAAIMIFFTGVALVSKYKGELRGEPLLPWDLFLSKEVMNIVGHFNNFLSVQNVVLTAVVILALVMIIKYTPKENMLKFDKETKIAFSVISTIMLIVLCMGVISLSSTFSIKHINWDQKMNYKENGHLLGFVLNAQALSLEKPKDYNKETVEGILKSSNRAITHESVEQPNIIYIQSEAFWDPMLFKELSFSKDPIPFFRYLQQKSLHGTMITPVYGGGTVNTEYEILTGFSTQFLPGGVIPFVQYIHAPTSSLARVLSNQNYETTGVHTYESWYYRRNKVYEHLGFDKFIGSEFFPNAEKVGEFIADKEFVNSVLNQVRTSEKRDFVYGVSMQAHGPYPLSKNKENTIQVTGDLSKSSREILETYTQTLTDVDSSLKMLIEGLNDLGEPSIVVFYGDHLPMLGDDFQVYREANYIDNEETLDNYKKMHSVPYMIWNNYLKNEPEEKHISASFLSSLVLEMANKEGNEMFNLLSSIQIDDVSILLKENFWDNDGINKDNIKKYKTLQHDLLFGEKYALAGKSLKTSENFRFGSEPMTITGTNPVDIQAGVRFNEYQEESVIGVMGENLMENTQIVVNGVELETFFHNVNYITAVLPDKYTKNEGILRVNAVLKDSMGNILDETKEISVVIK